MFCYLSTTSIHLLLAAYSFTFTYCRDNKLFQNQKHVYHRSFFRLYKTVPNAANPVGLVDAPTPWHLSSSQNPFSRTQRIPSGLQVPARDGSMATLRPLLAHCPLPCSAHTPALLFPPGNPHRQEETMANAGETVYLKGDLHLQI